MSFKKKEVSYGLMKRNAFAPGRRKARVRRSAWKSVQYSGGSSVDTGSCLSWYQKRLRYSFFRNASLNLI